MLERTLGVPIFQEQVMQLAMNAAGFTADEADALRRAMGGWERDGDLGRFEGKLMRGMRDAGYEEEFAERLFRQIKGFGSFGFPESHAASFALLVYDSAWLKYHEPAAFTCALLNSQPMGFTRPHNWCAMSASTASKCARCESRPVTSTAPWSAARTVNRRCDSVCVW